jgi:hypothetical protein
MDIDLMDGGSAYICLCGRSFSQSGALAYHKRSCKPSKRRLDGALEKAKEVWDAKKKRRVEAMKLGRRNLSHSETTDSASHVAGDMSIDSEVDNDSEVTVWKSCYGKTTRIHC